MLGNTAAKQYVYEKKTKKTKKTRKTGEGINMKENHKGGEKESSQSPISHKFDGKIVIKEQKRVPISTLYL